MSYDLEIRSDEGYSLTVDIDKIRAFILKLDGVTHNNPLSFTYTDSNLALYMEIDLELADDEGDMIHNTGKEINCIRLHIPYSFMYGNERDRRYFDVGLSIARYLGWMLLDLQEGLELS